MRNLISENMQMISAVDLPYLSGRIYHTYKYPWNINFSDNVHVIPEYHMTNKTETQQMWWLAEMIRFCDM